MYRARQHRRTRVRRDRSSTPRATQRGTPRPMRRCRTPESRRPRLRSCRPRPDPVRCTRSAHHLLRPPSSAHGSRGLGGHPSARLCTPTARCPDHRSVRLRRQAAAVAYPVSVQQVLVARLTACPVDRSPRQGRPPRRPAARRRRRTRLRRARARTAPKPTNLQPVRRSGASQHTESSRSLRASQHACRAAAMGVVHIPWARTARSCA